MKAPRVYQRLPTDEVPVKGLITRGICDHEDGTIYINPHQGDKEKLITAIHEALHYLFPKHTERRVEKNGVIIGEVVWKLGFRIKKNETTKRNTRRKSYRADTVRQYNCKTTR